MSPEAQRKAIAEWCGWKPNWFGRFYSPNLDPNIHHYYALPNFTSDLNALWEAEEKLVDWQRFEYGRLLGNHSWHATPEQKCEVLLRVIGRWKDTP